MADRDYGRDRRDDWNERGGNRDMDRERMSAEMDRDRMGRDDRYGQRGWQGGGMRDERDWQRSEQYRGEGQRNWQGQERGWQGQDRNWQDQNRDWQGQRGQDWQSQQYGGHRSFASRGGQYGSGYDPGSEWQRGPQYGSDWQQRGGQQDWQRGQGWSGAQGYGTMGQESYSGMGRSGEMGRGEHYGRGPRGYQRDPQRVIEEVNDRLTDHPSIDASDIIVTYENGEITLKGYVSDRNQKRLAEQVAESCRGVRDVHNQIRIRQEGQQDTSTTGREPTAQKA